ncbi:MAG: class I SAM-dependent methyltransferase [Gammaproteobacteria bacterium]|nr:class I SAM-dependent methyltransferase [Gammaproteobacteria bacterium]
MQKNKLVVIADYPDSLAHDKDETLQDRATSLAIRLQLDSISFPDPWQQDYEFALLVSTQGLSLKMGGHLAPGPVTVDFCSPAISYRVKDAVGRQAIARAVGVKPGIELKVLDATAGLGKDSFLLACLGCRVTMYERDPIIHTLLEDGIRRGGESEDNQIRAAVRRMDLRLEDFNGLEEAGQNFDIVNLDPMFPKRSKSARVKKDMFVLQTFLSGGIKSSDEQSLLTGALALARKRVVVKRPRLAKYLADLKPSHSLSGSSSRYDVYITG